MELVMVKKICFMIIINCVLCQSTLFSSQTKSAKEHGKSACLAQTLVTAAQTKTTAAPRVNVSSIIDPTKDQNWKKVEQNFEDPSFELFQGLRIRRINYRKAKLKEHSWLPDKAIEKWFWKEEDKLWLSLFTQCYKEIFREMPTETFAYQIIDKRMHQLNEEWIEEWNVCCAE